MTIFARGYSTLFLLSILCLCHHASFSQGNSLAFPSTNNLFLGAAGGSLAGASSVGVDQYTGTLGVNIPLCQVSSKELSIPLSLFYAGGRGIRVQDYASFTGLGWQLNAGGGVSRVVRAFPDEQSIGYLGSNHWGQQVASALQNNTALASNFTSTPPTADGEPDIFFIKTPYFSCQFTFDENGNAVFPNNSGLKIVANYLNGTTSGGSFKVIDDQGTQYFFGSSSGTIENTTTTLYGTSYTFPTTWYLDKIVSLNSKDVITFNYQAAPQNDVTYHYTGTFTWDVYGETSYDTTHPVQNTVQSKYLSSIVSSLGEADFTYAYDRQDDAAAARLSTIVLKAYNPQTQSNNTTLNTYTFNYSYFGSPSTDANILRLRLDNITVTGNNSATSTPLTLRSFTYNTANTFPTRKSLSVADFWGYLSYVPPMTYTAFPNNNRNPNLTAASTGVLTSIHELTGDNWNITYELNDYYNSSTSANTPVGGLRVNKIARTLSTGENVFTSYSYNDATGHSTGQIFSPGYTIIGFLWGNPVVVEEVMSESPSEFYDLNGNFTGYSAVKELNQNGGYTITTFTNFSDFPDIENYLNTQNAATLPDITSSISLAYKRGLVLNKAVYTTAGAKVVEELSPLTSYTSLTLPVQKKSWAYKWNTVGYNLPSMSGSNSCASIYYSNYENYRLTQKSQRAYDQVTPANYLQTSTQFGYSPANLRLIQTTTMTDSKGATYTQTDYHADDSGIPMVNATEQTAISGMLSAGSTGKLIHHIENRNSVIRQMHNAFNAYPYGTVNNLYLASTDNYVGSTLVNQQFYHYDPSTSNMVSTNKTGGKTNSVLYGYHSSLPIANIENAVNTYTATSSITTLTQTLDITQGQSNSTSFTTQAAGTITLSINPNPGTTYGLRYTLSGAGSATGTLCVARSAVTCTDPQTATLNNMPAGTYTLSINLNSGSSAYMGMSYSYPGIQVTTTVARGFFYEGFEENSPATNGNAHSGNAYYDGTVYGNYSVNFSIPDSRAYIIQWWSWAGGKWVMNQQAYTGARTISGIIDDVRVFPSDAQLKTFTYNPFVGKTGEAGTNGTMVSIEYDGLGRSSVTRDDDKNILTRACYSYAGQAIACPSTTYYSNAVQSRAFTRNNCSSGYQPGSITYTVAAGTYNSTISQADADQQALNDIALNGQNYANVNATCALLYYNIQESQSFTRNNCGANFTGGTVTYTVPAARYSTTAGQTAANQLALDDIAANGQNYANTNGSCTAIVQSQTKSLVLTGGSASASFTTTIVNSITLSIEANPGTTYTLNYSLSGPSSKSGSLCAQRSTATCSYPSSVTFTNMPVGTYTLTISLGSGSSSWKAMDYTYYGN